MFDEAYLEAYIEIAWYAVEDVMSNPKKMRRYSAQLRASIHIGTCWSIILACHGGL